MRAHPELPREPVHLNRYFHFTETMRDPAVEVSVVRYVSTFDHTVQSLLVMRPTGQLPKKLFFFLHGMDGDVGDAVVVRDIVKGLGAMVVATGGRGPTWLSDEFLADAKYVIGKFSKRFRGYYLIGISMGATQALALPGLLPERIRLAIRGVIALLPGSDLLAISTSSSHIRVRNTLNASVKGNRALLHRRSPINLINRYQTKLPFVIFYNEDDTLLLAKELKKYLLALRGSGHPLVVFTAPGNHKFTYKFFDYVMIFRQLGKVSKRKQAPPLSRREEV